LTDKIILCYERLPPLVRGGEMHSCTASELNIGIGANGRNNPEEDADAGAAVHGLTRYKISDGGHEAWR
jgi:hypothetical protein